MNVNEYGLVPGKATKNFECYKANQLCGFEPHIAERLVAAGVWKPTGADNAVTAEGKRKGNMQKQAEDTSDVFLVGVDSGTLKVPHNWREAHHKTKSALAKSIAGKDVPVEEVDTVIGAAVKEQEDALSA